MLACVAGAVAWTTPASGTPPNQARLDGRPTEYDGTDLAGTFYGAGAWGLENSITNLFVTWDTNYLYVALQGWVAAANKMVLMLDVDPTQATGATTTTNWTGVLPDVVRFNDVGWRKAPEVYARAFGLDCMLASEGLYNNVLRIAYDGEALDTNAITALFDHGNGATPLGTPVDMVVLEDSTACILKGFEARIPWPVLYYTNRLGAVEPGEIVPRGATLRMFANIHNNDPDVCWSSPDAIPRQISGLASWQIVGGTMGLLTTDNYVDIPLDADSNGVPDVAVGDVNAPYLVQLAGVAGKRTLYARFNEPLATSTVAVAAHWLVAGATPDSAGALGVDAAILALTNDLPSSGTQAFVAVWNVQDLSGNSKTGGLCFTPSGGGIESAVSVRFLLETASGLGLDPGASAFHVNGDSPLDWGYPPAATAPMTPDSGSVYYRDVLYPPGTPETVFYKYSGVLANTGTNNYEAVRLADYATGARQLALLTNGGSMVVTDYLGAAAGPWRDPGVPGAHGALFSDPRRGDAGARQRVTVTFQLDLSRRDRSGVDRVLIQGSDPLRGFNNSSNASDWAGGAGVGWTNGGLALYDDGTHGDTEAGNGIYARTWSLTVDGRDSASEPGAPHSLVGGSAATLPYFGDAGWVDRRTPRSIIYKYYVVQGAGYLESPPSNIEIYLDDAQTNHVLDPFVWANNSLPYKVFSNEAVIVGISRGPAGQVTVLFTNIPDQVEHGFEIAASPASAWQDFDSAPVFTQGAWRVEVEPVGLQEAYRAYGGPGHPFRHTSWTPNPALATGGLLRIRYCQNNRALAGARVIFCHAEVTNGAPWADVPMTFTSNGQWFADFEVASNANRHLGFTVVNRDYSISDRNGGAWPAGKDYAVQVGGRASWTPDPVAPGGNLTVTYDAAGGPLEGVSNLYLHAGFDNWETSTWTDHASLPMTSLGGNRWQVVLPVPAARTMTANFVFKNAAESLWDSNDGNDWNAFIGE
jgi:hypothetical protein